MVRAWVCLLTLITRIVPIPPYLLWASVRHLKDDHIGRKDVLGWAFQPFLGWKSILTNTSTWGSGTKNWIKRKQVKLPSICGSGKLEQTSQFSKKICDWKQDHRIIRRSEMHWWIIILRTRKNNLREKNGQEQVRLRTGLSSMIRSLKWKRPPAEPWGFCSFKYLMTTTTTSWKFKNKKRRDWHNLV